MTRRREGEEECGQAGRGGAFGRGRSFVLAACLGRGASLPDALPDAPPPSSSPLPQVSSCPQLAFACHSLSHTEDAAAAASAASAASPFAAALGSGGGALRASNGGGASAAAAKGEAGLGLGSRRQSSP